MNVNILDMQNALEAAKRAGQAHIAANPEDRNDWFPCGFVWLTYKCRKNAKEHVALLSHGWRWDDYEKRYTFTMSAMHNTQSMNYKAGIARAMLKALNDSGIVGFSYRERID